MHYPLTILFSNTDFTKTATTYPTTLSAVLGASNVK